VAPTVGVLALQGNVTAHLEKLAALGAGGVEVRVPDDLRGIDALILPGGESTTMSKLLCLAGLFNPLREALDSGLPVLGTCAGLILLSSEVVDGRSDQQTFDVLDVTTRRNAYGRQNQSFETSLVLEPAQWGQQHTSQRPSEAERFDPRTAVQPEMPAVFIRAPRIETVGEPVEVLAQYSGHPVLVEQGSILAATFHPEMTEDLRVHRRLLDKVRS
jgi:5'-phosphate synthase pdxT subunit